MIKGTPISVHEILGRAAAGQTPTEIIAALPQLDPSDVAAAFEYAAMAVRQFSPTSVSARQQATASRGEAVELDLSRILIVDDQELNRLYMQAMFRGSEFQVSVVADGHEALAQARVELPFLILSDIQMPEMDGFEFCRQLKANERTKNASVIFVTAHHRSAQKVSEGLDLGADDYIFRPFDRSELLSRVRAVARIKRAEEETRRYAQTVAQRNQQLELLNELALAVASSLELEGIFNSSMQKLSQLLDAEAVSLLLLNQEMQEMVVNISTRTGARVEKSVAFQTDDNIDAWVVQRRVPTIVTEILTDPRTTLGVKPTAISCLPMTSKEQVVGAIAIVNKRGGHFPASDWVLLNSAAGIIAVALENARLLQDTQQQMVDLVLLNEIGHALTSTLDLDQILNRTTQLVQESLRANAASLWLLAQEPRELVLTASSGPGAQTVTGFRLPLDQGIAGYVARTGEPYLSTNVSADDMFFTQVSKKSNFTPGSILCVPVQVKNQTIGVIQALHQAPYRFDQSDLRWLFSVASSVGIAIENGRLFSTVQQFNRRLERMVAERTQELAAEKEKTEAILASMADGLLVLDAENRVLSLNSVAEEMLSCCLDEAVGQTISPAHLEDPLWRCIHELTRHSEPPASAAVDVPDVSRPGGIRSIQANAAQVREGELAIGTVIVLRDITALKEVERMKARFMAGVTHELKTPLSIVQLQINNLRAYHSRLSEHKRDELVDAVQNQVKLLEQLVEDILTLSRLDASEARGQPQPTDLKELVSRVVNLLRPLAVLKGVALSWTPPSSAVILQADPKQLDRLVRNLVDNAIKYTPEKGSVEIKLSLEEAGAITLQVIDTGIGIPSEHQAHVFDRFYRVDPSHTIPGTGLGLAIVKEIVQVMRGELHLKSVPKQGSTFTITLPRH
jgi:PAS domain S-box-containing protein